MNPNIIELIRSFDEQDFLNTVDLHVHSTFSDGMENPEKLVEQAKKLGYSHIAICDHNTVNAYIASDLLSDGFVIPAVEFDCWFRGVLVHILGYGIDIGDNTLKEFYAKNKRGTEADIARFFSYRNPEYVIKAIHHANGIAVLAHPACCWCISLEKFVKGLVDKGLDGIECYYPYKRHRGIIKFHKADTVIKIANKYGLIKTGGTDNHSSFKI